VEKRGRKTAERKIATRGAVPENICEGKCRKRGRRQMPKEKGGASAIGSRKREEGFRRA